jgi:hypothetical protein
VRPAAVIPALSLSLIALACGSGCGASAERQARDRKEIEGLVADYAARLAESYRTGDANPLREVATEREIARVLGQIESLAAEGRALRADLLRQALDSVEIHRAAAATVTTTESWRLRVVALGTEAQVSESPEQTNQIVYTLTRDGGRWWILSRALKHSSEP